jgi:cytochrome c-type biogenesis protein CcmH/NrfF
MTRERGGATAGWTRREFLFGSIVGLLAASPVLAQTPQDPLPDGGAAGKLWDPARAGRPLEPVTAADNDAAIQAIEKRIHCTCGCNLDVYTCRTTDFSCTTSPEMHRQVLRLSEAGMSGEQIIAAFVREHGEAILMAPPKEGFNLAGYFTPGAVILTAGALLVLAMRRWVRRDSPGAASTPGSSAETGGSPEELERLRRELERIET